MLEFREAIQLVDKENNKYFYFQFVYCSTRLYIRYDLCINTGPADRMIPYRIGPVLMPNLISSRPSPLVNSHVCAPLYLIQRTCRRYSNITVGVSGSTTAIGETAGVSGSAAATSEIEGVSQSTAASSEIAGASGTILSASESAAG